MTSPVVKGLAPHLFVQDATAATAFYTRAFGAVEIFRNTVPGGRVLFVELALGPLRLLLSDPFPELEADAPDPATRLPLLLHLDVDDPDLAVRNAVMLGAQVEQPVEERFWGERYGIIRDPFGFRWSVSTVRQELPPSEITGQTPPEMTGADDRVE